MSDTQVKQAHPKGLYVLFMAEMWERFCYYGMRGLLTLYLIKILFYEEGDSYLIYGAYTALVYLAPVLGGKIADTILGYRKAVIFGAILMAIGEFVILGFVWCHHVSSHGARPCMSFGRGEAFELDSFLVEDVCRKNWRAC